jgi:hypothetical protein
VAGKWENPPRVIDMSNKYQARIVLWVTVLTLISQDVFAALQPNPHMQELLTFLASEKVRLGRPFDREQILDELGYDADSIVDFVKNEITYQAYPGVLRGIEGTLAGRSGNAHDQALVLAALLKDAGYEAQILVGKLSEDQARLLYNSVAMPELPAMEAPSTHPKVFDDVLNRVRDRAVSVKDLVAETEKVAGNVEASLADSALAEGSSDMLGEALTSAQAYRWVRFRDGPAEPWKQVHPAFPGAEKWAISIQSVETGEIDPADLQTVEIELWIEDSDGQQHLVSGQWHAPTANLFDRQVSMEIGSDAAMNQQLWGSPSELVKASQFFYVLIDGSIPKDSKVFDLYGDVYDSTAAEGLGTLFSTLNRQGTKALNALNDIDATAVQGSAKRQLTKVWLNFRVKAPGTDEQVTTRVLYEGNAMNEPDVAARTLLQRWDLDFSVNSLMAQAYQYRKTVRFSRILERVQKFQEFVQSHPDANQDVLMKGATDVIESPSRDRLYYLRGLFDQYKVSDDLVSYAPRVNILAIRHGIFFADDQWKRYEMVDIVTNTRWSFRRDDGNLVPDPRATIARGVWETRAEMFNTSISPDLVFNESAYDTLSTSAAFTIGPGSTTDLVALRPNSAAGTGAAWWQIDRRNGSTIGIIDLAPGAGGAEMAAEAIVQGATMAFSGTFFAISTFTCVQRGGDPVCCVMGNIWLTVGSSGVGFAIGGFGALLVGGGGWGLAIMGLSSVGVDLAYYFSGASVQCK